MAYKPDVRVRAHTVYRVDLYDKPKTTQIADGLGMSQANEIAQALAEKHGGGHVRMTGATTNYPVENVPIHLGPIYQELLSMPPGAEMHFRVHRSGQLPPVLYVDRIVPETVAEGEQPAAARFMGLEIEAAVRRAIDKLKPTIDDLARDSSLREIKQAMTGAWQAFESKVPTEDEIEAYVDRIWEKTGKAKSDLRQWAYVTLGDKLGEVPMTDRRYEIFCQHCAHGVTEERAFDAAGFMKPKGQRALSIKALLDNPHVAARIAFLRAEAYGAAGETIPIKDLRGNSSELEFRSAIRGALLKGKSPEEISDHIVAVTSIGNTKRTVVRGWITEEMDKLEG